jgi:hypothetical protein
MQHAQFLSDLTAFLGQTEALLGGVAEQLRRGAGVLVARISSVFSWSRVSGSLVSPDTSGDGVTVVVCSGGDFLLPASIGGMLRRYSSRPAVEARMKSGAVGRLPWCFFSWPAVEARASGAVRGLPLL